VGAFEFFTRLGFEVLLRRIGKFFDSHDYFLNATPVSGQAHTFNSPTTRLLKKQRFNDYSDKAFFTRVQVRWATFFHSSTAILNGQDCFSLFAIPTC
jgi:hypothetical protein